MNTPLSVIIPVLNEEQNLVRCLKSVHWAAEIFVVDSQSTDQTASIAEKWGAKVHQFHYQSGGPKKKNWALQNLPFAFEWVLFIDADEVVTIGLSEEISATLAHPEEAKGYWINRRFMFLGKWLKHAYHPNWNLRLFQHAHGRFEKLLSGETNSGDVEIHEHVVVDGKTKRLKAELEHYAFPSVFSFIEKHNRYSNWEARLQHELDRSSAKTEIQNFRVNLRRRLKRVSIKLPCRPLLRFLYVYLVQKGFLDGIEGYYFARLHACYEWMSVIKAHELRKNEDRGLGDKLSS